MSEKTIRLISLRFFINENWLRTGEGDMHAIPPAIQAMLEKREAEILAESSPEPARALDAEQQRLLDAWEHASDEIREAALDMLEKSASRSREKEGGGSDCAEGKSA